MAVICAAIINTSCSSEDKEYDFGKGETPVFTLPPFADDAALFEIPLNLLTSNGASLTAINFTESGKVIVELTKGSGVSYVTLPYNATVAGDGTLIITDQGGNEVGRITGAVSRSLGNVSIGISINVTIGGQTYSFNGTNVPAAKIQNAIAICTQTNNVARTWKVSSMDLVFDGSDIALSKSVQGGNLGEFVEAAQKAGANLDEENEVPKLSKTINGITIDKSGKFSIEYSDGTEVCNWEWTDTNYENLKLSLGKGVFGNKFLSVNSELKVDFMPSSIALTLKTDITGDKTYKAILTFVLK